MRVQDHDQQAVACLCMPGGYSSRLKAWGLYLCLSSAVAWFYSTGH